MILFLLFAVAPSHTALAPEPTPGLLAREIGPATMGGRIPSLDVVESDPHIQYVATAGSGVWKTTDDGRSWKCVFEGQPNPSIGAVAVAPSASNVVYVGTGEGNIRNSVSWGNGVFVSRDSGATWTHVGLVETHHIARIAVHPNNADTAFVAALGRAWGANPERGLFRTRNGGKNWEHVLKLDSDTGCVDVVIDPSDPNYVYAAAYRVRRGPFSGGNPAVQFGPLAGIYRSRDGGATFVKLQNGLPTRDYGRVGLTVYRKNPKVLFAVVQTDQTSTVNLPGQAATPAGKPVGSVDRGGIFRSDDRGDTWTKINDLVPRPFYFGKIRVDPTDERKLWVLGIPLNFSRDAGRTFINGGGVNVHVDHHALWINPQDPNHLILGNDGGLYYSRTQGAKWTPIRNLPISQFYAVAADRQTPYRVAGGLQDNGSWMGPSRNNSSVGILNDDWKRLLGMDGFHCQLPPDDPNTAYVEGQYGRPYRVDLRTMKAVSIRPRTNGSKNDWRFNWSTPLLLSPHDSQTLYFGGNVVFRSTDRGQSYRVISPDLTRGELARTYTHSGHNLTALSESPLVRGLLFAGSDDGRLHMTKDGVHWEELTDRLPGVPTMPPGATASAQVTRIEPSPTDAKTFYVALDRRRQDDTSPQLFRTRDGGRTFDRIVSGLPKSGTIHVVRADLRNPDLFFVGTEFGLYVSFDGTFSWQRLECGLPPVAVHDLTIHPTERELVIATHGRGIWVMDIAPLQELTVKRRSEKVSLFVPRPAVPARQPAKLPVNSFAGQNPPTGMRLTYRLGVDLKVPGTLEVRTKSGEVVRQAKTAQTAGLHVVGFDAKDLPAGEYTARLTVGTITREQRITVPAVNSAKAVEE